MDLSRAGHVLLSVTVHQEQSRAAARRRKGPAPAPAHPGGRRGRRRAKNRSRGRLTAGVLALTALAVTGCVAVAWSSVDTTPSGERRSAAPKKPKPSPSATRTKRPPTGKPSGQNIPSSGPGTFTVAPGTGERVGTGAGRVLRYKVEVEDGLSLPLEATAQEVERVLGDPRGWTADGKSGFQRVADGPTDFAVRIATPATVDNICGQYGLDTGGEVNCSVDRNVMVNLKRWIRATPVYAKDVTAYRALIINHEVGHFLGHGHVTCPGEGEPAPAMMQQIKGMRGCVPNVWPYDEGGRLITGPAVP